MTRLHCDECERLEKVIKLLMKTLDVVAHDNGPGHILSYHELQSLLSTKILISIETIAYVHKLLQPRMPNEFSEEKGV